jgi:cytochrome P450
MLRGNNIRDVASIHAKYGDIVRIAPNELSFAKSQAWDDIFGYRPGHQEFPRNPVWWSRPPGQPSSFITASDVDHARMRKVMSHAFSDRALKEMEPILQKYAQLMVQRLRETTAGAGGGEKGAVVNIVDWYRFIMFDIVGDLLFNESFDCLSNGQFHWWIQGVFNAFKINAFLGCVRFFPGLETVLFKCIPQAMKDLQKRHYQAVVDKTQRRMQDGPARPDIMGFILRNNDEKGMTIPEIESSMNVLSVGGSHNTASTLSGITNYLIKNPACLQRLTTEVRVAYRTSQDITLANLAELPYLNAVINEGLRMAPPFPAGLPRCVPEGGDTICGEFIPGGVRHFTLFFFPPVSYIII